MSISNGAKAQVRTFGRCVGKTAANNIRETHAGLKGAFETIGKGAEFVFGRAYGAITESSDVGDLITNMAEPLTAESGIGTPLATYYGEVYVGGEAVAATAVTEVSATGWYAAAFETGVGLGSLGTGIGSCVP